VGGCDSPNIYAFVGWQPTMYTDPLGLYQRDFHQGLTTYLGLVAGFNRLDAAIIGYSAYKPDHPEDPRNPITTGAAIHGWTQSVMPTASLPRSRQAQPGQAQNEAAKRLRDWHFPLTMTDEGLRVVPESDEASRLFRAGIAEGSLTRFGEGLHPLQDSFSHQGAPPLHYFDPTTGTYVAYGHPETRGGWRSTRADEPDKFPLDALNAAVATFAAMLEYRRANDPAFTDEEFHARWEAFANAPIMEFIRADKKGRHDWLLRHGIVVGDD
jgi:hypothetical protein